jgi:hypothetical protein
MGDESVVIYVGPERKRYLIHKDLLTKQSEFFDRALNGKFKEAEENSIYLVEESPVAFDLLVGWLYQDRIPVVGPPFGGFKTPEADATVKEPLKSDHIIQLESGYGTHFRRLVAPYLSSGDVGMGMGSPITPPKNEGTSQVTYQPHTEPPLGFSNGLAAAAGTPGALDLFEHISAQKEYRKWSAEELRAADYDANRKWNVRLSLNLLASLSEVDSVFNSALDSLHNSVGSALEKLTQPAPFTHIGHIPGIPHSRSLASITTSEENHQLALLDLCLLAETLCWTTLFNRSMSAYLLGEATLSRRPLPASHIQLIYNRSHSTSPCRAFAADSAVSHLRDPEAQALYAELSREYPAFLEDIFASLAANPALRLRDPTRRGACAYHVHAGDESCARSGLNGEQEKRNVDLFGKVETEARSGFGQLQHTRAWMDWREMSALMFRADGDYE